MSKRKHDCPLTYDDVHYQTRSGEWQVAKGVLQDGRFVSQKGVLGMKTGHPQYYKGTSMDGWRVDLDQFQSIVKAAFKARQIGKAVYDASKRIYDILKAAPRSRTKPDNLLAGEYEGHHGILNSLGGHDNDKYWFLVKVHYETHLLYKAVFRDVQCIGGVAAFVTRFPKGSDYKACLREWVADKPVALAIHDAFFYGVVEELDEDELQGLGYAQYMSELGKLGGAAGAAKFREQLGEEGYRAHFVAMGHATAKAERERLGEEGFRAKMGGMGKASVKAQREQLGEEGFCAKMGGVASKSMPAQREKHGKKFSEHRSNVSKKASDTVREKLGEEAYSAIMRKRTESQQTSAINLDIAHPAGHSDETDFRMRNILKCRMTSWKKKMSLSRENEDNDPNIQQVKALMKEYLPGFNRENNRRRYNNSRA